MQQVEDVYRVGKVGAWPAASPTSVLEEDPSDFMADWSWEASPPPPISQPMASPTCGSPLNRSPLRGSPLCSSGSSDAAMLQPQQQQQNSRATGVERHKTSRSLVETLQDCLTSLPQSTTIGDVAGHSMSDPTGATTTSSSRQSSSRTAGKRRPRASRRTPTTILETDPSDFRDMVQKLTGIPSATSTPGAAPVRPRPQRANPSSSFIRPETLRSIRRLPPMGPPTRLAPPLPTPLPPFLQHLQRSRTSEVIIPTTVKPAQSYPCVRSCKREFDQTEEQITSDSPPSALGSSENGMRRVMSAPRPSMPSSWWEQEWKSRNINTTDANSPFAMSSSSDSLSSYNIDSLAKENLLRASGTPSDFVGIDSADGQLAQEEQEFNFSQIESWLSAEPMRG